MRTRVAFLRRIIWACLILFSPTAESFGVSAQIGSGVVRGGPQVRFHEGSTRVPPGFHHGSTRVPRGSASCGVVRAQKHVTACCWGCHLSLFFMGGTLKMGLVPFAFLLKTPKRGGVSGLPYVAKAKKKLNLHMFRRFGSVSQYCLIKRKLHGSGCLPKICPGPLQATPSLSNDLNKRYLTVFGNRV